MMKLPKIRIHIGRIIAEVFTFSAGLSVGILALREFDAKPADWLGFAGSLIGSIITLLAAFAVLRAQFDHVGAKNRSIAIDLVSDVKIAVRVFLAFDPTNEATRTPRAHAQRAIGRAADAARATLDRLRTESVAMARAATRFDALAEDIDGMLGRNQDLLAFYNATRGANELLNAAEESLSELLDKDL